MLDFKKRLEDIKSKRDILSHTIPQRISSSEEEEAHKWWTNHKCFLDENNWAPDLEIGCLYPHIKLTPTSIGSVIAVACPFCGELKDVTDYETW